MYTGVCVLLVYRLFVLTSINLLLFIVKYNIVELNTSFVSFVKDLNIIKIYHTVLRYVVIFVQKIYLLGKLFVVVEYK